MRCIKSTRLPQKQKFSELVEFHVQFGHLIVTTSIMRIINSTKLSFDLHTPRVLGQQTWRLRCVHKMQQTSNCGPTMSAAYEYDLQAIEFYRDRLEQVNGDRETTKTFPASNHRFIISASIDVDWRWRNFGLADGDVDSCNGCVFDVFCWHCNHLHQLHQTVEENQERTRHRWEFWSLMAKKLFSRNFLVKSSV